MNNTTYAFIALLLVGGFLASGLGFGPALSVASGNVYDIYSTNSGGGSSTLVAHCADFSTEQSLQASNPTLNYSAIPNPACGAIVLTTTTVAGTSFDCGVCSTVNGTVEGSTSTMTTTTITTSVTSLTVTQSGLPTTTVATTFVKTSSSGLSMLQYVGLALSALSLVGLFVANRKQVPGL